MADTARYRAFKRDLSNAANLITMGRLLLIPPVIMLMDPFDPWANFLAAALFAVASVLDIVDGVLARQGGMVTVFGKFMDPLADKLMTMAVMVYLVHIDRIPPWMAVVMLGRDFYVSGLRQVAASQSVVMAAGDGGKIKTILQLVSICLLLVHYPYRLLGTDIWVDWRIVGLMLLYVAVAVSLWSAAQYTLEFRRALAEHRD